MTTVRRSVHVSGLVQGVGFRPFVYRLATGSGLCGFVQNNSHGISIEVQGPAVVVDRFLRRIHDEAPPLAHVMRIDVTSLPCKVSTSFEIIESSKEDAAHTLVSPDMAVCDDCLHEMFDERDRRYRYPFINCTNCGPRYTILRSIPYDRPATSMAAFKMCEACQSEYDDPQSRRFHAQPNACWECGPQVELLDSEGKLLSAVEPIRAATDLLRSGRIVAIKGLGGFHLACDAFDSEAVRLLRHRKHRVGKPFAIMVENVQAASALCLVSSEEKAALSSQERPIVLLRRHESCDLPQEIAPASRELGVFLPYTPIHHLLFKEGHFKALVMTSGNISEEPIAIDNREAFERLDAIADAYLVHDREILLRCDDSVVRVERGRILQLRRSRGFVPLPIFLHKNVQTILAVGGEMKNTICITRDNQAFPSQHIGDLENLAGYQFLQETADHLQDILEIQPHIIAHDLHPNYFSTKWAKEQRVPRLIGVQHHHAHIASCMAENHLEGPVIGIACDGTGYGTDGCVWGGEAMIADYAGYIRSGHIEYAPMPGGEAAIREPWRMALGYLWRYFGHDSSFQQSSFFKSIGSNKIDLIFQMLDRRFNSPLTSSCGRLFDAVAAIAGVRQKINYEGQGAIELEAGLDDSYASVGYPFELTGNESEWIISPREMFLALMRDVYHDVPTGVISARFHVGLAAIWVQLAGRLREHSGIDRVCLSGGTFNNKFLHQKLGQRLESEGFAVYSHSRVPCGDGGLCLGQAMIAAHSDSATHDLSNKVKAGLTAISSNNHAFTETS